MAKYRIVKETGMGNSPLYYAERQDNDGWWRVTGTFGFTPEEAEELLRERVKVSNRTVKELEL